MVTSSEIETVLSSIGVPPAARTPSFTRSARRRWLRLHGIVSIQVCATPTIGFARYSSSKPMGFSITRGPAPSRPSRILRLLCRVSVVSMLSLQITGSLERFPEYREQRRGALQIPARGIVEWRGEGLRFAGGGGARGNDRILGVGVRGHQGRARRLRAGRG